MRTVTRTFETSNAKREAVPLLVGLVGPSNAGKTYSALRIATGVQRVTGGDIEVIDTEARRALHYADQFRFRHTPFGSPFSPLDYLAAIEQAAKRGSKVIVVDSMSHEHEGPGGVLEMHASEIERLISLWKSTESKVDMAAWKAPKAERRRMINGILQLPIVAIFCFRAKEKIKVIPGKDPEKRGFMAIAGEEFTFEMTVNCLLLPQCGGVPTWQSKWPGEQLTIKLPDQFKSLFSTRAPLSEEHGEAMARWAAGGAVSAADNFAAELAATADLVRLEDLAKRIGGAAKARRISAAEFEQLKAAGVARRAEIEAMKQPPPSDELEQEEPGAAG